MAKFCNILKYVCEVYVKVKEVEYKEVNIKNWGFLKEILKSNCLKILKLSGRNYCKIFSFN